MVKSNKKSGPMKSKVKPKKGKSKKDTSKKNPVKGQVVGTMIPKSSNLRPVPGRSASVPMQFGASYPGALYNNLTVNQRVPIYNAHKIPSYITGDLKVGLPVIRGGGFATHKNLFK